MKKILSLLVAVILISAAIAPIHFVSAYEEDIHYWLKFKLALYCGFTPNQSRLIATGDEGVDANFATEPTKTSPFAHGGNPFSSDTYENLNIKIKWHALPQDNPVTDPSKGVLEIKYGQDMLYDRVNKETNPSTKLIKFGQYLHYMEDKWSHWGYTYEIGHGLVNVFSQSPDDPAVTAAATKDMIYDVMTQLGGLAGQNSKCYNTALGGNNPFISPTNFAPDFKDQYPNGPPPASNGVSNQPMSDQRDSYFDSRDNANSTDKISDVYNDLIKTAKKATEEGKSLEEIVALDIPTIQEHIAKEMGTDTYTVQHDYDFITPWELHGPFSYALWLFSSKLNQGIHWEEDGEPIEKINPDPEKVFDDPTINPHPHTPSVTPTPPTVTPQPPPGQNAGNIPNAKTAMLLVIKHVINDGGGTAAASDFKITVEPGPYLNVNPYQFSGSEQGTWVTLSGKFDQMLHFTVKEYSSYGDKYKVDYTDNCRTYINAGENLTCIVYNTYIPSTTQTSQNTVQQIPTWVKNNANWWSQGQIGDKEFATAIGYLVSQGIIKLQSNGQAGANIVVSDSIVLPQWVKNNANWWAKGIIADSDFIQGIQYMLDNNIITFSKSMQQTTSSSQIFHVTFKVVDQSNNKPIDGIVMISGNGINTQKLTDRDGQVTLDLKEGMYNIQIDSSNYPRHIETVSVSSDETKTIAISKSESQQPQESSSVTQTPQPTQSSSTPTSLQVYATPQSASFTHNIGQTTCPESITTVNLSSNQQGTWNVSSNPSWSSVSIQGNTATISFNCQLSQYVTQSLSGQVVFQFTSSNGQTQTTSVSITGQVNQG